jgi:hypothetical protein
MAAEIFHVEVSWNVKEMGPVMREAVAQTARIIRDRARADVSGALRNPGRFVKGTDAKVEKIAGGYAIDVTQKPAYAKVWEFGGVSVGKPLLWLPAPGTKVKLRHYRGQLIRPKGKRVLIAARAGQKIKGMSGTGSTTRGQVKYVGITSVTHRKRLHLAQIAFDEANKFATKWSELMRA